MTPNELATLIAQVGFPIAVAIWLLWTIPKVQAGLTSLENKVDRLIALEEYHAGFRKLEDV